jgi:hypothetical protein
MADSRPNGPWASRRRDDLDGIKRGSLDGDSLNLAGRGLALTGEPTALGGSNLDRPRTLGALLHLELNALAAGEPIEVE